MRDTSFLLVPFDAPRRSAFRARPERAGHRLRRRARTPRLQQAAFPRYGPLQCIGFVIELGAPSRISFAISDLRFPGRILDAKHCEATVRLRFILAIERQPNVQSIVTLLRAFSRTASSSSSSCATNSFETPRRWTGTVSVSQATPASVSATTTPRASVSASARRTRPLWTSRATRRVMADREMNARSASSVIRSSPPACAS